MAHDGMALREPSGTTAEAEPTIGVETAYQESARVFDDGQGGDNPECRILPDLTAIALQDVLTLDEPVLAGCLERVIRESQDEVGRISLFNSAI